jgi:ppGpp synthetase/RelA/SpoT-type nucleotidyltranferase
MSNCPALQRPICADTQAPGLLASRAAAACFEFHQERHIGMPSLDFDLEEALFRSAYAQQLPVLEDACAALTGMVAAVVARAGGVDIAKVEGRVKEAEECIRKFIRKYRPTLEESNTPYSIQNCITDLIGVRVVCLYEDELEKIAQIVRSHFAVIDVTDKVTAVESTEASFGYKGLHLDLRLSAAERDLPEHVAYAHLPFELQVRTIIQDSWSVLDHRIKYKKSIPGQLKRRINVLSALFELARRNRRAATGRGRGRCAGTCKGSGAWQRAQCLYLLEDRHPLLQGFRVRALQGRQLRGRYPGVVARHDTRALQQPDAGNRGGGQALQAAFRGAQPRRQLQPIYGDTPLPLPQQPQRVPPCAAQVGPRIVRGVAAGAWRASPTLNRGENGLQRLRGKRVQL